MNRTSRDQQRSDFHPPKLQRLRRGSLVTPSEDFECLSCRVNDILEKEFRQFETGEAQSPIKATTFQVKKEIQRSIRRMSFDENTIKDMTNQMSQTSQKPALDRRNSIEESSLLRTREKKDVVNGESEDIIEVLRPVVADDFDNILKGTSTAATFQQ